MKGKLGPSLHPPQAHILRKLQSSWNMETQLLEQVRAQQRR